MSQTSSNATKNEELSVLPIQEAIRYVNDTLMKNDHLETGVTNIIVTYIFNINLIKSGMVFFGRCTQGSEAYEYNLIIVLTKMKNAKVSKVPYFYQSFDFDSKFIWPTLSDSASITTGTMQLIDNGLFNQYQIIIKEHKYDEDTIGNNLAFNCTYTLSLTLPDYNEECEWLNWNEYMNRISVMGRWDRPSYRKYGNSQDPDGNVYLYRMMKWDDQINVKQYIPIKELKETPAINGETKIESAVKAIESIVSKVTLNVVQQK